MARRKKLRRADLPVIHPHVGNVLGLDVSSSAVGWAVFSDGVLTTYGKYNPTGAHREHGEKLAGFDHWLREMLSEHVPTALVVEAPYPGPRKNAFAVLAMYFGVVLAAHFDYYGYEMPRHHRIGPRSVKLALKLPKVTQYEQRKRQMVEWINKTYHLDLRYKRNDPEGKVSDDDIADAIALVHTFLLRESAGEAPPDDSPI